VGRVLEGVEQEEPAEGDGGAARVEPAAAELLGLGARPLVRRDLFDADAAAPRLVDSGAHTLGPVAARRPGLKVEVRGRADLDRAEAQGVCGLARKARRDGDEGRDAALLLGREHEEAREFNRFVFRGERVARREPDATELAVDDRAVNLRR
jgi:hypothetical protein